MSKFTSSTNTNGAVLIIVLWITSGLVAIVLIFGQSVMMNYRASDHTLAGIQSTETVHSAVRYISYILNNAEEPGTLPDETEYEADGVVLADSLIWLVGRDPNSQTLTQPVFNLIAENSKINLNTATTEMLEALPKMTADIAAAIVDWRDEDSEVTEHGAETDTYSMGNPNYQCKNAPFETVYELMWVYGIDKEILLGEDTNHNGVLDPNENDGDISYPSDNQDGTLDFGLAEFVTVYSYEANQNAEGESRLNINSAEQSEIEERLSGLLDEDRVTTILQSIGQQKEYESLLQFYIASEMTAEEFALVEDELTISDEEQIPGLINVNVATEAVLACIPGIGQNKASELVAYRLGQEDALNSMAWILEVLEEDDALEAAPYLTTHSYQFSVDVCATNLVGHGYRRTLFIINTAEDEPQIIYRQDRTGLGWALGSFVRQQIQFVKENPA